MKFDLKVLPEIYHRDENNERITTKMELSIAREDFIVEYEKDVIACAITLREIYYMFYRPYGLTSQISDDVCHSIYNTFMEDEEYICATIHVLEIDHYDNNDYRKRGRDVRANFTMDKADESKYYDLGNL